MTVAEQGELGLARRLLEEAVDVFESTVGDEHPSTVEARSNLRALKEDEEPPGAPPASARTQPD